MLGGIIGVGLAAGVIVAGVPLAPGGVAEALSAIAWQPTRVSPTIVRAKDRLRAASWCLFIPIRTLFRPPPCCKGSRKTTGRDRGSIALASPVAPIWRPLRLGRTAPRSRHAGTEQHLWDRLAPAGTAFPTLRA